MTFFPLSLKALAMLAIAALVGVAVALTRSKSIAVLCWAPNGSATRPLS